MGLFDSLRHMAPLANENDTKNRPAARERNEAFAKQIAREFRWLYAGKYIVVADESLFGDVGPSESLTQVFDDLHDAGRLYGCYVAYVLSPEEIVGGARRFGSSGYPMI